MPPEFDDQHPQEPAGESHYPPNPAVLENWKDIANHFGVVSRTAQLWERTRGLPVHRKPGPRGRVYAYVEELNAWAAQAEPGTLTNADGALLEESTLRPAEAHQSASDITVQPAAPGEVAVTCKAEAAPEAAANPASASPLVLAPPVPEEPPVPAPRPPSPPRWGHAAWAIPLLALIVLGTWLIARMDWSQKPLAQLRITGLFVTGLDPLGRSLWQYRLPAPHVDRFPPGDLWSPVLPVIVDLDGDGHNEGLAWHSTADASESDVLYCFDADGSVRWAFQPNRVVRSEQGDFAPTFNGRLLLWVRYGGGKRGVLAVANHRPYYPAQVVLLSAKGEMVREYWHSGYLMAGTVADLNEDGHDEIYLGGISNGYRAAVMVALDPDSFGGTSHDPAAPRYNLHGFDLGRERARVIFPRTELSRRFEPYNAVHVIQAHHRELVATVIEMHPDHPKPAPLLYHFDETLHLREVSRADSHVQLWNTLLREGKLARPFSPKDEQGLTDILWLRRNEAAAN